MKKKSLVAILGSVPAMLLATVPAHASDIVCQIFWFLPQCTKGTGGGGSVSVAEPATLIILATGFGAAGLSAWRARKKQN